MARWQWIVRLLSRQMWFRAALFCGFAIVLALAGAFIGPFISYDFGTKLGAKSVDNILELLASSMLAVTTFSLTAMVQAYSGATSNITPRAVQLLIEDSTAQNALATFLGSFLFAIVGIIALSTGVYGVTGRVILYGGTILVIALIVLTLLRWIQHIAQFGRVADTIERVERAATRAVASLPLRPHLGARDHADIPADAARIATTDIGRVTHVDYRKLEEIAAKIGAIIHIAAVPGAHVDPSRPLAWLDREPDLVTRNRIVEAFTTDRQRAFDQDPRFGLVVLGEIASRALSPAVNDPGTAIAVLEAAARVLATLLRYAPDPDDALPDGLAAPRVELEDVLEDIYRPIARDGAGTIEVAIRLQKSLAVLRDIAPPAASALFGARAATSMARSEAALDSDEDRDALRALHTSLWAT